MTRCHAVELRCLLLDKCHSDVNGYSDCCTKKEWLWESCCFAYRYRLTRFLLEPVIVYLDNTLLLPSWSLWLVNDGILLTHRQF